MVRNVNIGVEIVRGNTIDEIEDELKALGVPFNNDGGSDTTYNINACFSDLDLADKFVEKWLQYVYIETDTFAGKLEPGYYRVNKPFFKITGTRFLTTEELKYYKYADIGNVILITSNAFAYLEGEELFCLSHIASDHTTPLSSSDLERLIVKNVLEKLPAFSLKKLKESASTFCRKYCTDPSSLNTITWIEENILNVHEDPVITDYYKDVFLELKEVVGEIDYQETRKDAIIAYVNKLGELFE